MRTVRVQRLEYSLDSCGYLTYVFKLLDENEIEDVGSNYIMVVQRPNWNQPFIEQGVCGYLKYKEIQAGVDTWYNSETGKHEFYLYDDLELEKFIQQTKELDDFTVKRFYEN